MARKVSPPPLQKSLWSDQSWIFGQDKQSNNTRGELENIPGGGSKHPF